MSYSGPLGSRQIKAARALLDWSQDDLAAASKLSVATVRKLELGHISPRGETMQNIRRAFEDAGLEFIQPDGVRHRPEDITIYQGYEGAKAFYDNVYEVAKERGGDIVLVQPSEESHFSEILKDYRTVHIERMAAIRDRAHVKCILTGDRKDLPALSYVEYRWISKNYIDSVSFYVYGDKYGIIVPEADPSPKITVIESRAVANAFRRQFYSMWEKATPLDSPATGVIPLQRKAK